MRINEIFESISGEAGLTISQGAVCTFVRLQGCNLECTYCDTKHSRGQKNNEMTIDQIKKEIEQKNNKKILITGGEPLLQKDELMKLLLWLFKNNYIVQIETNGTIPIPYQYPVAASWNTNLSYIIDYKTHTSGMVRHTSTINKVYGNLENTNSILKFVIGNGQDIVDAARLIKTLNKKGYKGDFIISPMHADISSINWIRSAFKQCLSRVLANQLIFSLQLHKILNLP